MRITDATLAYTARAPILQHVDLEVGEGEIVALVGPSGAGKTTLLKAIAGLLPPQAGRIEVLGVRRPARNAPGTIGYIPQRLGLVTNASAKANVLAGALHRTPVWRAALQTPGRALTEEALAALAAVGLAEKADEPVKELSGGQQRRVAVARALLQRPRLLLADEFLGELDHATAEMVEDAVLTLARTHGTTIVLVEHHVQKATRMASRVFETHEGRLRPLPQPEIMGGT